MKKILLLSVGSGAGHVRAARAIHALAANYPDVQVTHLDVLDLVAALWRILSSDVYIKLTNNHPVLWGLMYRNLNEGPPRSAIVRLMRWIERSAGRPILAEVRRQRPDAIICTHFIPAELFSHEIGKGRSMPPVWVQVTDFDLRGRWIMPHLRGHFVACEEMAWRARTRGMAADAVLVTGIPVMPAFSGPFDRRDCAAQFGLDPARKTLLLMSGAAGLSGLESLAERLLAIPADFQLVVLAGRNQTMLQTLQNLARRHPDRLFAQGFTDQIERLMACADLAITKPGGLTCAECLAMGLPTIVYSRFPGLEERNADFLLEQGVAFKADNNDAIVYRVEKLLATPECLAEMRQKSLALGRPQAGRAVLDRVLGLTAPAGTTG